MCRFLVKLKYLLNANWDIVPLDYTSIKHLHILIKVTLHRTIVSSCTLSLPHLQTLKQIPVQPVTKISSKWHFRFSFRTPFPTMFNVLFVFPFFTLNWQSAPVFRRHGCGSFLRFSSRCTESQNIGICMSYGTLDRCGTRDLDSGHHVDWFRSRLHRWRLSCFRFGGGWSDGGWRWRWTLYKVIYDLILSDILLHKTSLVSILVKRQRCIESKPCPFSCLFLSIDIYISICQFIYVL